VKEKHHRYVPVKSKKLICKFITYQVNTYTMMGESVTLEDLKHSNVLYKINITSHGRHFVDTGRLVVNRTARFHAVNPTYQKRR
jgi:hypothetical protein